MPHLSFLHTFLTKEFIGFLLCNGFAAVVNFGSRIAVNSVLSSYVVSVVIAYGLGMLTAFILNKLLIFTSSPYSTSRQAAGFIFINILGLVQTVIFSLLFRDWIFPMVDWTFYPAACAHLIGIGAPIFTSFIGHKYISFGSLHQSEDSQEK